jgi:Carboxypeptidase regulatory-like domain
MMKYIDVLMVTISVLVSAYGAYFFWKRSESSKIIEASKSKFTLWTSGAVLLIGFLSATYQWKAYTQERRTYRAFIRVVDSHDQPVENARVWTSMNSEIIHEDGNEWVASFLGSQLNPNRSFFIYVSAGTGAASQPINFNGDSEASVKIMLGDAFAIRGIVVNVNGQPLPGANVVAGKEKTATNDTGTFALLLPNEEVSEGPLRIFATAPGFMPKEAEYLVGKDPVTIVLHHEPPLSSR